MENSSTSSANENIQTTLNERGQKYGPFIGHANISQRIKAVMNGDRVSLELQVKWATLPPDQQEALEMIAHKIARILNGDNNYVDSWVDIAGYAKLVANRLQGESA